MDFTVKEKYLLSKLEPKIFYLRFFKSFQINYDNAPIRNIVSNVMLMANN